MSRSKNAKGPAGRVQTLPIITDAKDHGTEGRTSDTWTLEERDRKCSRHTCCKHWCKILRNKDNIEVYSWCREGEKKMYLEACLQKIQHVFPFIVSIDRLLGLEAEDILKRISSCLTKKWQQPYPSSCGYVNIRIAITLVWATHRCIRGTGCLHTGSARN